MLTSTTIMVGSEFTMDRVAYRVVRLFKLASVEFVECDAIGTVKRGRIVPSSPVRIRKPFAVPSILANISA